MNNYPTLAEVEAADHVQLSRWMRFLRNPGLSAVGKLNFEQHLDAELEILNRIMARHKQLGGWTPEISKLVGWDRQ